jgi:hypothetical protein
MGLNKRILTSSAGAVADYTTGLLSHIDVGVSTHGSQSGTQGFSDLSGNNNPFWTAGTYTVYTDYITLVSYSGYMYSNNGWLPSANRTANIWYRTNFSSSYGILLGNYNSSNICYITLGNVTGSTAAESFGTYTDYGSTDYDYFPQNGHYAYTDGTWRMFTLVNNGQTSLKFYMNGQLVGTSNGSWWSTTSLSVGKYGSQYSANASAGSNMDVGGIRVYDHAVADADIDAIFQATRSKYGV